MSKTSYSALEIALYAKTTTDLMQPEDTSKMTLGELYGSLNGDEDTGAGPVRDSLGCTQYCPRGCCEDDYVCGGLCEPMCKQCHARAEEAAEARHNDG